MDLSPAELFDIGLDAVEADRSVLPPGMQARVLAAATDHQRPRSPTITSLSAFMRTAAELGHLLDTLSPDEWTLPTAVYDSSVRELVVHLVGVERYVLGQLGQRPRLDAPTREDHYPVSRAAAADLDGADGAQVVRVWWQEAMALIAASAEAGPHHPVTFHHLAGSVRGLMVVRTFELWTHDDDIRAATGRPLNDLDDARLSLMSSTLMDLLAQGIALSGTTRSGRTARLELTGPGGGTYDVALAPGETAGPVDVTIRTGALELCRLAADRVAVDALEVDVVDGDRSLLEPILVGAGVFALD
jgi:uncharacterized protein (TIGR03083 family)